MALPRRRGRAATAALLVAVAAPGWVGATAVAGTAPAGPEPGAGPRIDGIRIETAWGWLEWFGIPATRNLVVTVHNDSPAALGPGRVNLAIGTDRTFVAPTEIDGLAAHQQVRVSAAFSPGWASFGSRPLHAEVRLGSRPPVPLDRTVSVPPPFGLVAIGAASLELVARRRRRRGHHDRLGLAAREHPARPVLRHLDAGLRGLGAPSLLLVAVDGTPRQLWRADGAAGGGVRWARAGLGPPPIGPEASSSPAAPATAADAAALDTLLSLVDGLDARVAVSLHLVHGGGSASLTAGAPFEDRGDAPTA